MNYDICFFVSKFRFLKADSVSYDYMCFHLESTCREDVGNRIITMTLSCLNFVMFVRRLSVVLCHLNNVRLLFLCLEALLIKVCRRDKN